MIRIRQVLLSLCGSAVLAFGLYQIHSISAVTEGGALGLTLLLRHWLSLSPAVTGFVINGACYLYGARVLGREFIFYSLISGGGFSMFYAFFERLPLLWPELAAHPAMAAVAGAAFVGVGVGVCVRAGGAPTGDDALAMALSRRFGVPIERVYLLTDLTVLLLSLSYIPANRIVWSLLTVTLSGKIIGIIQRI